MTGKELREWKFRFLDELRSQLPVTIKGVSFRNTGCSLAYKYGNAKGFIFPSNGMIDHDNYYPLFRISPMYSDECRFRPSSKPTLDDAADAVILSWETFIK